MKKVTANKAIILLFFPLMAFCNNQQLDNIIFQEKGYYFPYNLSQPVFTKKLPGKLDEISGITFLESGLLAAVNDEKGNIYIINIQIDGIEKYDFGDDADYEDIEWVNGELWVLKSNGQLTRIKNFEKEKKDNKMYDTALTSKNDTEGLGFDPANNRLLIACKANASVNDENIASAEKAIYAYDLNDKKLSGSPVYTVNEADFSKNMDKLPGWYMKLTNFFTDKINRFSRFSPSGIATHPVTGNMYIISASDNYLVVLNRNGKYLYITTLNDAIFPQPEGICFSPDGELYISNEANGGEPTLLKFISDKKQIESNDGY